MKFVDAAPRDPKQPGGDKIDHAPLQQRAVDHKDRAKNDDDLRTETGKRLCRLENTGEHQRQQEKNRDQIHRQHPRGKQPHGNHQQPKYDANFRIHAPVPLRTPASLVQSARPGNVFVTAWPSAFAG